MIESDWHKAESTKRPEQIDTNSSQDYVLIRANIISETLTDEQGNTSIIYKYDEKFVPRSDWGVYEDILSNTDNISENASDILATQEGLAQTYEETYSSITNLEEAIAEVYEMILPTE